MKLRHRISALDVDVDFCITQPWTILFGPSGSGKTTILRAIAGLIEPDSARITHSSGGETFPLVDTDAGICVPPHRRGTPLASQRPTLFPHMRVLENLAYGHPAVTTGRAADSVMARLPALFRIDMLLEKWPAELSGGEAQRVSLARATMAGNQRILLLDEPFTGLDLPLRDALIANLLAWQAECGTPILSVTHDVAEAFQLDAEVIKIADGKVVAQGPVAEVLAEERERLLQQLMPS